MASSAATYGTRTPEVTRTTERASSSLADNFSYISVEEIQKTCALRIVSRSFLAPFDRVKYVMQTQRELQRVGTLRGGFRTSWDCVRHLSRLEGNLSFWRGNCVQAVSILPIALAQLFIALPTQAFIFDSFPAHTALGYTAASYCAVLGGAMAASMICYPLEFARFRLAVDVKRYKGAPYEFRGSMQFLTSRKMCEHPNYLYTGLGLYILGSLIYQAVHNVFLGILSPFIPSLEDRSGWWPVAVQVMCGLTVAGTATMCLHPLDLIRHRMMLVVLDDKLRYPSAMSCAVRIAQREGLRGFFRGGMITLGRMIVATGLVLVGLPY